MFFFFFCDSNWAFRKATYIPLLYKIRSKHSLKIFFEKRIFEKNFFFEMKFLFGWLWPGLLKKLPMYLSHRRSGSNMVLSFWVIVTGPLKRMATYLFHRGSSPNIIRKKKNFEKMKFWKFWNEVSFWVIVIGPLKRLPTYLSHKGSGPNVVRKKFWNMIFFFF